MDGMPEVNAVTLRNDECGDSGGVLMQTGH